MKIGTRASCCENSDQMQRHPQGMPSANYTLTREQELHWLALKMTPGLGTRSAGQLIRKLRTPEAIFRASLSELEGHGLPRSIAQSLASGCAFEDAADQQNKLAEFGSRSSDHRSAISGTIARDLDPR